MNQLCTKSAPGARGQPHAPPDDAFRAAMPVTTYMWGCIFYMLGSICFVIGTGFYLADAVRLAAK